MKDCCLDTLFSLGQACVDDEEILTRPCIYITTLSTTCQPFLILPIRVFKFSAFY